MLALALFLFHLTKPTSSDANTTFWTTANGDLVIDGTRASSELYVGSVGITHELARLNALVQRQQRALDNQFGLAWLS